MIFKRKTTVHKPQFTIPDTMQAGIVSGFGGIDTLRVSRMPVPALRHWDVLVAVRAATVTRLDCETRAGRGLSRYVKTFPAVLGWELSGTVVAAGQRVTQVEVGDEILGLTRFPGPGGAHAEYALLPQETVVRKPENLSFEEAAALPLGSLAAWQALYDVGGLRPGRRVLINAAAGGIGHLAVQLARHHGAHVIGTASEHNHEFLRSLGVEEVLDYGRNGFTDGVEGVDVVVDTIGGAAMEELGQLLRYGGIYALIADRQEQEHASRPVPGRVRRVVVRPSQFQLDRICELAASGALAPATVSVPALDDIRHAHSLNESGHVRGRVVVRIQ